MTSKNLIVVGAGHLGCRAAEKWRQLHPDAKIFLKTHHDDPARTAKWTSMGYIPFTDKSPEVPKAPFVIFSAPPTGIYSSI